MYLLSKRNIKLFNRSVFTTLPLSKHVYQIRVRKKTLIGVD